MRLKFSNRSSGFLGGCVIASCNSGYSHCDTSNANGCEVTHNTNSGSCAGAALVAAKGGDEECGLGCGATSEVTFATRTGLGESWYRAQALENSSCTALVTHKVRLAVPD